MAITVVPVTPSFAAEVGDVDLSGPLDPTDLQAIKDAFAKYAVLIFPDQHLSQDQHLDFAKHFGPLETTIGVYRKDAPLRVRKEFADVSNLNHDNEVWGKESRHRMFQMGEPDLAYRQLVQAAARARIDALRALDPVGRRTHRICRRAGGLRRAARRHETPARVAGGGAFDLQFARTARLHQFQRRRTPRAAAGTAGGRTHDPRIRPQVALSGVACRPHLRDGRARGPRPDRRAHRARDAAAVRLHPSLAASTTWSCGTIAAPCTAAPSSTTCAGSATCSAPPSAISRPPASRKGSRSQPRRIN